jgi:hypothetical protein
MKATDLHAATEAHPGCQFFDRYLNPIEPRKGQRFLEVHLDVDYDGDYCAKEGEVVQYEGDEARDTFGDPPIASYVPFVRPITAVPEGDARVADGDLLILQS